VAGGGLRGRLADQRRIEMIAAIASPLDQLDRAVEPRAFLVAGDEQRQRAAWFPGAEKNERSGDEAGDAALHVDGSPPIERAAVDDAFEGWMQPACLVTGRHHVGMTGEDEVRLAGAYRCEEILDIRRAG